MDRCNDGQEDENVIFQMETMYYKCRHIWSKL